MSRKLFVSRFLIAFFCLYFCALIFRIDYFPLTWVPMYARYEVKPILQVRMIEKDVLKKGFKVTRQNGEVDYIGPKDLNIPRANFRRLFTQRAYGLGPPKLTVQRYELNSVNDWLYQTIAGEDPTNIDWGQRLIRSLNNTFGLVQNDPEFIISATAVTDFVYYQKSDLLEGNIKAVNRESVETTVHWIKP